MKRIFILLTLLVLTIFVKAQYPVTQNIGSDSAIVRAKSAIKVTTGLVNGRFDDTTAANLTRISQYAGAKIVTGDIAWLRNSTATAWIREGAISTSSCGLLSGGYVVWDSLLVFTIAPAEYQLCCDFIFRNSSLTHKTLAAAHATLNRFDLIALDSTGVVVVTGTPAADAAQPQPQDCQIVLTYIYIPAGSLVPGTNVCGLPATDVIYDETGGTEWTPATFGVTIDFSSTAAPYHLTKAGSAGAFSAGQSFTFTKGSTITLSNYTALRFFIRLKSAFHPNAKFGVFFQNSTSVQPSRSVIVEHGRYNFVRTTVGTYMEITIPISEFLGGATTVVDRLYFLFLNTGNADGFYIDWIQLQQGICQPPTSGGGTVTSVSASSLSPLFTTVVNNPTTTPQINFTLTNAAGGTVFGNNTSGSAAPAYTAVPVLGRAGTTGTLGLSGTTSGTVTIQPQATAGTFNFNLPTTAGTATYLLTSQGGAGTAMTWTDPATLGGLTADNGLTENVANNVQLGGTLINATTTIDAGNNVFVGTTSTYTTGGLDAAFTFSNTLATGSLTIGVKGSVVSSNGSSAGVLGSNSGAGAGVYGNNTGAGAGVVGLSSSGLGGDFRSTSGIALQTFTNTGATSANFTVFPSSTNTIVEVARIARSTSGTAAAGIGGSFAFYNEPSDVSSVVYEAAKIASTWTDPVSSTRTGDLQFWTANAPTVGLRMAITGDGRLYGTALHNNAGAVTGTTNQYIASGTYTPTLTNSTNITSSTAYSIQWIRVGNVVTVSGKVAIRNTVATTPTNLGISLPIASALVNTQNLAGTGYGNGQVGEVLASTAADEAQLRFVSNADTATEQDWFFTFTYLIL